MNLSPSERADLARELDTANYYLSTAVSSDDEVALRTALGYGVAALCRFASEVLKPDECSSEDPNQLKLFPDGA